MKADTNVDPVDETHTATEAPGRAQMTDPRDVQELVGSNVSPLPLVEVPVEYYTVEGEQGRGGVGVVLRARDRRLDRIVALKQLQSVDEGARVRFEREMRLTARLQHPGVVPVHESGRFASGEPFYAMKLVEGRSLKEVIAEKRGFEERLGLLPNVLAVAETISYAHSQHIIHRDLKPSNVVVGTYGETVVIDWGLARARARASRNCPPWATTSGASTSRQNFQARVPARVFRWSRQEVGIPAGSGER